MNNAATGSCGIIFLGKYEDKLYRLHYHNVKKTTDYCFFIVERFNRRSFHGFGPLSIKRVF